MAGSKKGSGKRARATKKAPRKAAPTKKKAVPTRKAAPTPKAATTAASNIPAALAAAVAKAAKRIDGKFCYGLPHYDVSMKLKFDLLELGDMSLFGENDVDTDEWPGWIPFAELGGESQFLAIHTEPPFAVGMWEHENGKIYTVWSSFDEFASRVLQSKKDKTPFELLDGMLDKARKLIDADKYKEALALLEPAIAKLPPVEVTKHDDQLARLYNLLGLALKGVERYADSLVAFERAVTAGEGYANLNIMDVLLEKLGEPKRALDRARAMQDKRWLTPYERTWCAIYVAKASLDLGDAATAEKELRSIVARYQIKDADLVNAAREAIEEYSGEKRAGSTAAQGFLAWLKPRSYDDISPDETKANRAWWTSLPRGMGAKLFEEVKLKGDASNATDEQIARCIDTEECDLDNERQPILDVTPFLRLTNARRIGFYGDPDSIEPLRVLPRLERLTINNDVIKDFAWPSRAQRDLWDAAEKGDIKAMGKALAAGADVNMHSRDWGKTALHKIPFGDKYKAAACWLVEQGADPHKGNHGDGDSGQLQYWPDDLKKRALAAMKKFGFRPLEEEPYRAFSAKRMSRGASFESPEFKLKGKSIGDGDSLAAVWPRDATLKMDAPKKDDKVHDIMRVRYDQIVVSEKVAELLRGDANTELLPVTLKRHDNKDVPGSWYFVNALAKDCLIVDKCAFQWNHIDPDSASAICAYIIDPARVGDAQMFRPTILNSRPTIVTRALAEKLAAFDSALIKFLKR